ncbi:hypothetical protein H0H93_015108 [Arthromyces matolae]|nr:hypothetical protein H0H93_015108 [Arthromyces matolae]
MENVVRVSSGRLEEEEEEENVDEPEPVAAEPEVSQQPPAPVRKPQQTDKLKDLFAPREEEAGFSLLGHLDLDLELDDEIPFAIDEPERQPTHAITNVPAPAPTTHILPQLDPKRFLFFPHQGSASKAGPKDLFDVAMENKWHWRDLEVEFYRKDTEEGIRKRWEESKVELTKEWKRRWREAGKISRRRKGGDTADS